MSELQAGRSAAVAVVAAAVGACVVGATVVGAAVTGDMVVGAAVTGLAVVGAAVVGTAVVGAAVAGTAVVGDEVTGAAVVGACVVGAPVVGAGVAGAAVVGAEVAGDAVIGAAVIGAAVGCEVGATVATVAAEQPARLMVTAPRAVWRFNLHGQTLHRVMQCELRHSAFAHWLLAHARAMTTSCSKHMHGQYAAAGHLNAMLTCSCRQSTPRCVFATDPVTEPWWLVQSPQGG